MASASVMVKSAEESWSKAKEEFKKDATTRDQDLAAIKDWLKKQPHLPDEWDDTCLLSFLQGCNHSLERCKQKLDTYFTMRNACPEFFLNRDITRPELKDLIEKGCGATMPGLTPDGKRISYCKATDHNLDTHQLNDLFKITMMFGDLRLKEPTEGLTGEVYIVDAAIVRPSHLGTLSISNIKKFLTCVQGAYPMKLKEMHIINVSKLVDTVYSLVKPFVKEKARNRIYFHRDYTGLHEFIPKEFLPVEYDGTGYPLETVHKMCCEKLMESRGWFKQQESVKANESLRPGNPKNYEEMFGIDGSFRQLAID